MTWESRLSLPTFLAVVCSWFLIIQPQKSYLTRIIFIENRRSSSCFLFSFSLYSFFVAKMSSLFDLKPSLYLISHPDVNFCEKEKKQLDVIFLCARQSSLLSKQNFGCLVVCKMNLKPFLHDESMYRVTETNTTLSSPLSMI